MRCGARPATHDIRAATARRDEGDEGDETRETRETREKRPNARFDEGAPAGGHTARLA
jgi:hypothetical protein